MGLFGVAFILLTFGYIAWEQRNRLIQRNEDDLGNAAFFLADHTARLLEVTDLTLKQATALVQGRSWDEVETSQAALAADPCRSRMPCPISRTSGSTIRADAFA